MAQSVTISAPGNGSTTAIPCTAAGYATPADSATIRGMAYQINAGPVNGFGNFTPAGGPWSFPLTVNDCPVPGVLIQLTVYMGDSSGTFITAVTQFTRSA